MESSDLDDLYGDAILEHCRHPRNHDALEVSDATARAVNPFCGDEVDLQLALEDGRVSKVGAQAVGCSINQATTSMLSEAIMGGSIEEIASLAGIFRRMMSGDPPSQDEIERLGDLRALAGVLQYPVRIKCARLSWTALEDAIEDLPSEHGS